MVRIKALNLNKNKKGLGTISDVDGTEYRAVEV